MSSTNLMLGGHWDDEWPEYVEVQKNVERHEDGVDLYRIEHRAYFPAKVCHFEPNSTWTSMCSNCGETFPNEVMENWHHEPWRYCPNCGAIIC